MSGYHEPGKCDARRPRCPTRPGTYDALCGCDGMATTRSVPICPSATTPLFEARATASAAPGPVPAVSRHLLVVDPNMGGSTIGSSAGLLPENWARRAGARAASLSWSPSLPSSCLLESVGCWSEAPMSKEARCRARGCAASRPPSESELRCWRAAAPSCRTQDG
jgi:hypothetical protein